MPRDRKNFLGLLNTHIEYVVKSDPGKSENDCLLSTIKLLLDWLDCSDDVLSGYEDIELRHLFVSFNRVAQKACDLYTNARERFDPKEVHGVIANNMKIAKDEIAAVCSAMEALEKDSAELLSREKELKEKNAEYSALRNKILELKKGAELVSSGAIESLKAEEETLLDLVNDGMRIVGPLSTKVDQYRSYLHELRSTFAQKKTDQINLEENIMVVIRRQQNDLEDFIEHRAEELKSIEDKINRCIHEYEELDRALNEKQDKFRAYIAHLRENKSIAANMRTSEDDVPSIMGILDEIKKIEEDPVIAALNRFDGLLESIIDQKKQIKEKIENLQTAGGGAAI